jgi:hypothetical protein
MAFISGDDPNAAGKMKDFFGPGQVEELMRQAIQTCWMMLPDDKKSVDELEKRLHGSSNAP